ncbi:DUF4112 domain-containing protein [Leisingera sp. HS039]|uniref:DUF4112 domain-containing protein n=1 Tax=unclassified Leisingera TaxID=2614906 RepID=UPI001070B668|nr:MULTISPECIES: DUF4112 domain-containing protein [unclassified Leisingera]MBQ4827523.1 DUF4112 domain-containing protein [Leisingera sp. HS039]QBR35318.1 DUF4112 domain-containing protein [Leisingera sp. NJS201]
MLYELDHLDRISTLLDIKFPLPGTQIPFGWDTVAGLIPRIGDAVTLLPAGYLLYKGYWLGAGKRTMARMAMSIGLDANAGAAPVVGDVFNKFFKSKNRTVTIFRRALENRQ